MLRDRTDRDLVRLAIVGITAMLVAVLLSLNFQRLPLVGNAGTTYHAEFTDAAGLTEGEEVRVAGIKVGQVKGVELGDQKVIVTFSVEGIELGTGTTAGIEVKTLLGQHYLSITPAGTEALADGATIPLARTSTPINIVPAFQRLTEQTQKIDTDLVAEAFDTLSDTLGRTAPEMGETLRGLARLSHSISSRDEDIRALFARANFVSGVVAARDRELGQLVSSTDDVLALLDRRRETITRIIDGTASLSRQLTGLVSENDAALRPALRRLNGVLEVLRKNRQQIEEMVRYAGVYGREFSNVGGTGRFFDASFKLPRNFALCQAGGSNPTLESLLTSVLSPFNQALNDSSKPCLPLGHAAEGAP